MIDGKHLQGSGVDAPRQQPKNGNPAEISVKGCIAACNTRTLDMLLNFDDLLTISYSICKGEPLVVPDAVRFDDQN
jgi:hypothetical protein